MATETLEKTDLTVLKGKDLKIAPQDAVFLLDSEKALLFQKDGGTNSVKALGMIEYTDFIKFLSQNSIRTDKLPRNCIEYISKDTPGGRTSVFVVELPPEFRAVSINMKRATVYTEWAKDFTATKSNDDGIFTKTFNLPMPYITFFVRVLRSATGEFVLNDIRVFASTLSARNDKNPMMCYLPMNNLYEEGKICWGVNSIANKAVTAAAKCDEMINLFFNSPFNDHIPPTNIPKGLTDIPYFNERDHYNPGITYTNMFYTQWEKTMTDNPLKMLQLKYRPYHSYEDVLNMLVK